jgi:hypothetical protein
MEPPLFALLNLSEVSPSQEAMLAISAVITIAGTALCWSAPHHRMSMEERAKDGQMTEEQARRKIRFREWSGPIVTVIGCALLLVVFLR